MASDVIDPVAERIKAKLADLAVEISESARHKWAPARLATLPAAVIEMPQIHRTPPEQAESQLGSNDWTLTYTVCLYVELKTAPKDQAKAVDLVESFIKAIDADPSLGDPSIVEDAKVISATPEIVDDEAKPMILYVCELQIVKLV